MALRTFTATPYNANVQRKNLHLSQQAWQFNSATDNGATKFGTIGDVLLIAKIPHGVVLTDFNMRIATPSTLVQGVLTLTVGSTINTLQAATATGSALSGQTITAVSAGQAFRFGGKPLRISCSDDAAIQYGILAFTVTAGTESTTFCCAGSVMYDSDLVAQ